MPFTFAHPAIVLPLTKWNNEYFSLTGLIIGSMVPDVEYFIRMKIHSEHSHTFSGLFYFDLPVGLILYLLFVSFIRASFILHLPAYLRDRFQCVFRYKSLFIVLLSIFIGAVTHLFWDSFTHEKGYIVQHINLLKNNIIIVHFSIPMFKILQHGSTLVGILMIGYYIKRLPMIHTTPAVYLRSYWIILFVVGSLVILGKYLMTNFISFGDWVVTFISAGLLGTFITSIIYYVRIQNRQAV
jgi:hypothetical protein